MIKPCNNTSIVKIITIYAIKVICKYLLFKGPSDLLSIMQYDVRNMLHWSRYDDRKCAAMIGCHKIGHHDPKYPSREGQVEKWARVI